jgi:hypothetical protein
MLVTEQKQNPYREGVWKFRNSLWAITKRKIHLKEVQKKSQDTYICDVIDSDLNRRLHYSIYKKWPKSRCILNVIRDRSLFPAAKQTINNLLIRKFELGLVGIDHICNAFIYDDGTLNSGLYTIRRNDRDLASYLTTRTTRISELFVIMVAKKLVFSLLYLHKRKIKDLHYFISPKNVLMTGHDPMMDSVFVLLSPQILPQT